MTLAKPQRASREITTLTYLTPFLLLLLFLLWATLTELSEETLAKAAAVNQGGPPVHLTTTPPNPPSCSNTSEGWADWRLRVGGGFSPRGEQLFWEGMDGWYVTLCCVGQKQFSKDATKWSTFPLETLPTLQAPWGSPATLNYHQRPFLVWFSPTGRCRM